MELFRARESILCRIAEDVELWRQPILSHRLWALAIVYFLFCADANKMHSQQPFVHSNDVQLSIRTDRTLYNIGDQIIIYYSIKNVGDGAMYVPRSQWDVKCGNPPHLWSQLKDSFGNHYEPGYGGSCLGPSPVDRMSVSERMRKDAALLKPGQKLTGSFNYDSKVFAEKLKPGTYRLEAVLYGWNLPFDNTDLAELAKMGAPFFIGETAASSRVKLHLPARLESQLLRNRLIVSGASMLFELITAVGAAMFVIVAVQTARQEHAGIGGYVLIVAIGLAFAVAYEWTAHKLADVVDERLKGRSPSVHKWSIRGFFFGLAVFPVVAAMLGSYVSSMVLRVR